MNKLWHSIRTGAFLEKMPACFKSTAIQQGFLFWVISIVSLGIVSSVTVMYVEYELDKQNFEIYQEAQEIYKKTQHFSTSKQQRGGFYENEIPEYTPPQEGFSQNNFFETIDFDDDPIDDDDITEIMMYGFYIAGLFEALFTAVLVIWMSRLSQKRINRIETVLEEAAEGKLSARTGVNHTHYDLARVATSVDEMLSRLQGSVAAMSDISANIAHELKTPITRLRHNLLTLRDEAEAVEGKNTPQFYAELNHALDDSLRLASIFDALLRISQIESGARRSRFNQIELTEIITLVSDIYTDVAEDAEMSLQVISPQQLIPFQGDKELLTQQIVNLVENALRYCNKGSRIRLSCGRDDSNKRIWITVEDNGPGISSEERDRVFERLYRVDKSRTDGGLGLGLSFAKAVAGLHHGTIHLYDCMPGLGVRIEIPTDSKQ